MLSRRLPFLALVLGVAGGSFAVPAVGAEPPPVTAAAEQPAKAGGCLLHQQLLPPRRLRFRVRRKARGKRQARAARS